MAQTSLTDRFWSKVAVTETPMACWPWQGTLTGNNRYGQFHLGGQPKKRVYAHRFAYEQVRGPIPEGMELDHLCRNPACANPSHLEPVTHLENIRRGTQGQKQAAKTHCPKGHPYDEANTKVYRGERQCRTCLRARWKVQNDIKAERKRNGEARA